MSVLNVEHVTEYDYADRVELAAHLLHLRPRELPWQAVRRFAMRIEPEPARVRWAEDPFGNAVARVFLERPHHKLVVTVASLVAVSARPDPPPGPGWEEVVRLALRPGEDAAEYVFGSARAPADARPGNKVRDYAAESFPPGRPVGDGLVELMGRIRRDFRFDSKVTTVSTPVERVMQLRAGVCQDFTHLMIAGLRSLGLPARYVSGYLRTLAPPGRPKMRGADASHAWVSAWMGPELGWLDLDPTNDVVPGEGHVWLGWGRDFADVSPLQGILLGGGRHTLKVAVDVEPEAEAEAAAVLGVASKP